MMKFNDENGLGPNFDAPVALPTEKKDKRRTLGEAQDESVPNGKSMIFAKSLRQLHAEDALESNVCGPDGLQKEKKHKWWQRGKVTDDRVHKDQSKEAAKPKESTVSLLELFSFADKLDYVLMFCGTVGATLHGAALPLMVLSFGQLLNGIGTGVDVQRKVNQNALNFVYLSLSCLGSSWLEVAFWMHSGHRQSAKLRAKYLHALLQQDVGYFDTDTNTGDVVNSIATDPLAVQDAISEKTGHFLHHMASFISSFVVSFSSEWRIAIGTLLIIPAIALPGGIYAFYLTRYTTRASSAYSEASSVVQEAICQVRTVYSFVAEKKFVKAYSTALEKTLKLGVKCGLVKGLGTGAAMSAFLGSFSVLLLYGGILVRKGEANGGAILATFFNVILGSTSLAQAMSNLTPFGNARASAFKIFRVIRHEPSINKPDKSSETLETVEGQIELRNVDFSYPSRRDVPIFQDFSLIIPPGRSVAIVGSSGSGKSTIVSLIERFYDPTAGEVLLDGVDLKKLDLRWLRRQIGLVNQEPALFATTIAANIAYGSDTPSQEVIEEAAKVANAHSFISQLPDGYQTQVGERGVQLSGGQKQRIAIARAVVKNPRVLLLDEATSALDSGSEQLVQDALDRIMVGRTTVVVAHRLSTIRNSDTIAVVEQGSIVEQGTHDDLISREDGAYSALVLLQELSTTRETTLDETTIPSYSRAYSPSPSAGSPYRGLTSAESRYRGLSGAGSPYGVLSAAFSPYTFFSAAESPYRGLPSPSLNRQVCDATQQPKQQDEILKGSKGSWKRLLAMTKDDWKHCFTAMVGSMGTGCIGPICGFLLGYVVSTYYNPDKGVMKREITSLSLYFAVLGVSCMVFCTFQHYSLGVVGERLVNRVRQKLFGNILRNELGWFDEADNNSSQLAARLASDAATVKAAIGDRISIILQTITLLVVSFSIAFYLQWKMALVIMAALPLIVFAIVFERYLLISFAKDQAKAYERATRLAGEAVSNIRTVAAFNAEDKVQALFTNELEGPSKQSFRKGHAAGFGYGLSQGLMYATEAMSLWYAGKLVASGQSDFSAVIKVFLIVVISAHTAAEALVLTPDLVKGGQAVASLFQLMDRETKIEPDDPEGEKTDKIRGHIDLKLVTMVYPSRPDVIVLRNMNLKVSAGHSLALVGASGSGKSSIVALIERFYDPSSGQILIDGKDIKQYNLQFLRQHIALVQQEPALFAKTIYENIVFGKAGASEAEVIEAARAANAHKFISSLPDGYNTLVGERGVQLSGGQKQRVAIARAVLKDPTIFLLDEATSALDAESEKVVQEAIDRLMNGRTTVIIAHRLSTIRGADSIAVLSDGKIVEQGSHTVLLSEGGAYSRLIKPQRHA